MTNDASRRRSADRCRRAAKCVGSISTLNGGDGCLSESHGTTGAEQLAIYRGRRGGDMSARAALSDDDGALALGAQSLLVAPR
jgi:hypothetical protein